MLFRDDNARIFLESKVDKMYQLDNFLMEKNKYQQSLSFIEANVADPKERERQIEVLEKQFRSSIGLYLSPAIQYLSQVFQIHYQVVKETMGYDSNFHKISTQVPKTEEELIQDMKNFKNQAQNYDEEVRHKVDLAIEVIANYYHLDFGANEK